MALTKAEMEAFKKKNFDKSKKVTKAQLDKLRKEGTPTKAIAKYKNDPSMLEALNRFYGKDRVKKAGGGSTSTPSLTGSVRGGPGAKMPKRPSGGPGAKMTARDGRGASSTSKGTTRQTTRVVTGTNAYANQAAQRRKALENMTPQQRKRADQAAAFGKNVLLPASLAILPVGKIPIVAKGATAVATKVSPMVTKAASKVVKSKTAAKATSAATKVTTSAAKVGNKVSTKTKAAEKIAIRKAQAVKKNLTKSKSGKHSAGSKSSTTKTPSGIKPLNKPYTPDLTKYPKVDEAKLRRIMGK